MTNRLKKKNKKFHVILKVHCERLFLNKLRVLKEKRKIVQDKNISHSGTVEEITKIDGQKYEVKVQGYEQRNLKRIQRSISLVISLNRTERTNTNPWGIEVDELKEIPTN